MADTPSDADLQYGSTKTEFLVSTTTYDTPEPCKTVPPETYATLADAVTIQDRSLAAAQKDEVPTKVDVLVRHSVTRLLSSRRSDAVS